MLCSSLTVILIGCGGGGGGGGGGDDGGDPVLLNGMAAAGAPIIGTVNVRGANDTLSLSPIRSDGTFSVDVTALATPFVVWAEGTALGKSVTLYTTCDSASTNANVTPATDLAMAMAMGSDPAVHYQADPNAPPPSGAELDAAVQTITVLLTEVFTTLGLSADFDIMTSQFNADGSGFDQLLDMVTMINDGQTASIVDTGSQTTLFEQDLDSGTVMTDVGSDQANIIISANLTREGQIEMILRLIEELYAQSRPDAAQLAASLDNYVSSDFMDSGQTAAETWEQWAIPGSRTGPSIGTTISNIAVYRSMTTQTFGNISIEERGPNVDGVWVTFNATDGSMASPVLTSFVQEVEGGQWKWAGGRCPFMKGCDMEAQGLKRIHFGDTDIYSGLDFDTEDTGNLALNRGVDVLAVFNPGLPQYTDDDGFTYNMVAMRRPDPEVTELEIIIPEPDGMLDHHLLTEADGLNIGALSQEFVHIAADENDQPLFVWISLLPVPPVTQASLVANEANYFPVITTIGGDAAGPAIASSVVNGDVTVVWQHPANADIAPRWTHLRLGNNVDADRAESLENPLANPRDWTSATFTYPGQISNPQWGYLAVAYGTNYENMFETVIDFSVVP